MKYLKHLLTKKKNIHKKPLYKSNFLILLNYRDYVINRLLVKCSKFFELINF